MKQTVLAVDLGGTKILVGEVAENGMILSSRKYASEIKDQRTAVDQIKKALHDFLKEETIQGELMGIGICVVGRVDSARGVWLEIRPDVSDPILLSEEIEKEFNLSCSITNDVSSGALAELALGIGRETENFVYINIGTGIAARIVSDGKLLAGGHYNAGEVGHMVVDIHSDDCCPCGRYGCVELYASGLGMHNQTMKFRQDYPETSIKVRQNERVSFEELLSAYKEQDLLAIKVINQALKAAAALTMNLVRTSDPEAVIFGGGVMTSGWFLEKMVTLLNAKTMRFVTEGVHVTELDPQTIALKGAAVLVVKQMKGEKEFV